MLSVKAFIVLYYMARLKFLSICFCCSDEGLPNTAASFLQRQTCNDYLEPWIKSICHMLSSLMERRRRIKKFPSYHHHKPECFISNQCNAAAQPNPCHEQQNPLKTMTLSLWFMAFISRSFLTLVYEEFSLPYLSHAVVLHWDFSKEEIDVVAIIQCLNKVRLWKQVKTFWSFTYK